MSHQMCKYGTKVAIFFCFSNILCTFAMLIANVFNGIRK